MEVSQNHFEDVKDRAINFLSPNISFSYFKAQFDCIGQDHNIDLTIQIDQCLSLTQIFLEVK